MKELLISVVVPVYQVKDYLEKCIDSIVNQSYTNLEIILVDDGSTDGSGEICDRYKSKDSRILVIHKENEGLVSARKSGVNIATGDYLCYVDGDDWIETDYIEKYVKCIEDKEIDMVWGLTYYKEYADCVQLCGKYTVSSEQLTDENIQKELYAYASGEGVYPSDLAYSLCTMCFRKEFIRKVQNYVSNKVIYNEDFFCMMRCLLMTDKVKFMRNDGYHYVQRENSMVRKKSKKNANIGEKNKLIKEINDNYPEKSSLKKLIYQQCCIAEILHGNIEYLQNEKNDEVIPYRNAKKNRDILLYGVGNAGLHILEYFQTSKICKVVGCMDERAQKIENVPVPLYDLRKINNLEYDYILITSVKGSFIEEMRQNLKNNGVEDEKIAYFDATMLESYG